MYTMCSKGKWPASVEWKHYRKLGETLIRKRGGVIIVFYSERLNFSIINQNLFVSNLKIVPRFCRTFFFNYKADSICYQIKNQSRLHLTFQNDFTKQNCANNFFQFYFITEKYLQYVNSFIFASLSGNTILKWAV